MGSDVDVIGYGFGLGYDKQLSNSPEFVMSSFFELGFGFEQETNDTMNTENNTSNAYIGFGVRNSKDAFESEMKYAYHVSDFDEVDGSHILSGQLLMDLDILNVTDNFSIGGMLQTDLTNNVNHVGALVRYQF
jgi:hypothetical protein